MFFNIAKNVAQDILKVDFTKLLEHLVPKNEKLADVHIRNLMFGDYAKPEGEKVYDEITDLDELTKVMDRYRFRVSF